jgi:hypothetical protein
MESGGERVVSGKNHSLLSTLDFRKCGGEYEKAKKNESFEGGVEEEKC